MTFGRAWLAEWPLDPQITYLNHGTVGVTPRRMLDVQRQIRDEIERQPSAFLLRELADESAGAAPARTPRMRAAANVAAAFLGARGDDFAFVDNVTTGVNAVLRSFPFEPDDELLITDLGYGGVAQAARYAARERGAVVRTVTMPFPWRANALADAYVDAVGPKTRLAIVDHVTAQSALIFPLADVARRMRARGVAVLADGAHVAGAIPLDIPSFDVDWYAGNLHKWAWVPRSSGYVWASRARRDALHPVVISWGLDEGFAAEFDAPGTRDPSAHLAAPAAIALFQEWGLDAIRAHNHALAWNGARHLAREWDTPFDTAEAMIGTMATVQTPESLGATREEAQRLRDALLFEDQIEVQVHAYRERIWVRISAQIYNDMTDITRLADAVTRRARQA